MGRSSKKRILAANEPTDFVGRAAELERLLSHARGESRSEGLMLLAAPFAGVSELLRQTYDRLFIEQNVVIPFYFEIKPSDRTVQNAALRFLCEFLMQTVAFRRRDARILDATPEIAEIAELAVPSDGYWIDRLVETYNGDSKMSGDRSFVRNCLSAPLRAAANDARAFVMIDGLHAALHLDDGETLVEDIKDIFSRASIPFVISGQRRFLFAKMPFETMPVGHLSFGDAGTLSERLSARTEVAINDQTRDLIAVQLGGNPEYITSLFASAAANGNDLNSFDHVEQAYTNEIFGGRIGKCLDRVVASILPEAGIQANVLRLLSENIAAINGKIPVTYWKKHAGLAHSALDSALDALNYHEIVGVGSGSVEIDVSNIVLGDYIRGRERLEIDGEPRALAVGDALSENVRRAPDLMARYYRRSAAIGLGALMSVFDGRQISPALIDYGRFSGQFKGASDDKILKALKEDNDKINLPKIVYTANTAAFYPKLNELCDAERSSVALGFADQAEKDETAWIAVEIDSKLEATRELAEFWCDRLEMVALNCNFPLAQLWLVAPEGFSSDAMNALRERGAYGSSRKQVELLAEILNIDPQPGTKPAGNEYEIVVPMGEDTEMIAAHTIEEIAKRHNFPRKGDKPNKNRRGRGLYQRRGALAKPRPQDPSEI